MHWPKSPSLPWAIDLLGGLCFLALTVPWFILGREWLSLPLSAPLLLRLLLISFLARGLIRLGKGITALEGKKKQYLLATAIALLGMTLVSAILFLLPKGVASSWHLTLLLGLVAWSYGIYWGYYPFENHTLQRQMVFGAISLALFFILARNLHLLEETLHSSLPFILFWVMGIIISTALSKLLETLPEEEGEKTLTHYWPPILASLSVITLTAAVILGLGAPLLIQWLRPITRLLLLVLEQLLIIMAYILGYVAQGIFFLLQRLFQQQEIDFEPPTVMEPGHFFLEEEGIAREMVGENTIIWIITGVLALLAMGYTIYHILKKEQKREGGGNEEIRESYASMEVLKEWALLQLQEIKESIMKRGEGLYALFKDQETAVEIYHDLLKRAAQMGQVKPKNQTAHRFQERIRKTFQNSQPEAQHILQSFSRELYQEEELPLEEIKALKKDLKKIKEEGTRSKTFVP